MDLTILFISISIVIVFYFIVAGFSELHKGKWGNICRIVATVLSCVIVFTILTVLIYALIYVCVYNTIP